MFFSFAGLTSLALGLSLMMGLKLEENFNRPWAAKNLIDFWSRWHMTLSNWCRDYVFYPVTAITRLPVVGLLLAMLAMGCGTIIPLTTCSGPSGKAWAFI